MARLRVTASISSNILEEPAAREMGRPVVLGPEIWNLLDDVIAAVDPGTRGRIFGQQDADSILREWCARGLTQPMLRALSQALRTAAFGFPRHVPVAVTHPATPSSPEPTAFSALAAVFDTLAALCDRDGFAQFVEQA